MAKDKNQEVAVVGKKTPARRKKTQPSAKPVTMEQVLYHAIDMKTDPNALEKLFELYERDEARKAEKSFNVAMAAFRAECPIVQKKTDGAAAKGNPSEILWKYADLAEIETTIKPYLAKNGLSYTWDSKDIMREDKKPGKETICWVSHILGHKTSGTFTSSIVTGTSAMNGIQEEGATIEYGRRWSLKLALGIVVAGEDDENQLKNENGKAVETITKAQTKLIENQIGSTDETLYKAILTAYEVTELHQIPADKLKDCKKRITDYKKAKREREKEKAQKKEGDQTSMEIAT